MIRPRPYQHAAAMAVLEAWKEARSTLVVLPTGMGKTILFADIIRRVFPAKALVIAHREELIFQARDKVQAVTGYPVEIEMADQRAIMGEGLFGGPQVVVSTIQTQTSGGDGGGRMGKFDPNDFGLLIVDECHHIVSASFRRLLAYYTQNPRLKILGVTATPDRTDEEALGQVFESVAYDYEILDVFHMRPAMDRGWDRGRSLSEKQRNLLSKHYPDVNLDTVPYAQAKQLLNELFRRWDQKLCTYKQARILNKHGYDTKDMTMADASEALDRLFGKKGRAA